MQDVYAKIQDAASGGSGGSNRAFGGCGSLGNSLNKLAAMLTILSGTKFATLEEKPVYQGGYLTLIGKTYTAVWGDIQITSGDIDIEATVEKNLEETSLSEAIYMTGNNILMGAAGSDTIA